MTAMPRPQKPVDVEYLREAVRAALRADPPPRGSMLADMQTRHAKGEQRLRPAKGPHVVHATQTRPPGYSQVIIDAHAFAQARYVQCIWKLRTVHIQSILARYSPSDHLRRTSRTHLASEMAKAYGTTATRARARIITVAILDGAGSAELLRDALDMTPEQWRTSRVRVMKSDITERLASLDVDSLLAWESTCYRAKKGA